MKKILFALTALSLLPQGHSITLTSPFFFTVKEGLFGYFETQEEIILEFYDVIYCDRLSGLPMDHVAALLDGDFFDELEIAHPSVPISPTMEATGRRSMRRHSNWYAALSEKIGLKVRYQTHEGESQDECMNEEGKKKKNSEDKLEMIRNKMGK